MTPQKFLEDLLSSQNLSSQQTKDLDAHTKEITEFLRAEFGEEPIIKYAGSKAKGTMIAEKYDLDIVCYFPSTDNRSLREIREDVAKRLSQRYLTIPKSSAERVLDLKGVSAPSDFHIDVVPGRFIENTKDVFLHVAYGDKERMQTNLKTHIDHILNSGCAPIIRLTKLWAGRNSLQIKTFVLELFVVQTLAGSQSKTNLEMSFIKVLRTFAEYFSQTQLIDPANANNVVSRLVSDQDKTLVEQAARKTLEAINATASLDGWLQAFGEEKGTFGLQAPSYVPGGSFQPTRQWRGHYDNRS